MENQTIVREFILLGFSDLRELQLFHFAVFLSLYLAALVGNFLIIKIVAQNQKLHSPMYFFLVNLSFLDACYISTTVPKSMANSLINDKRISFCGCVAQVLFITLLAPAELAFLTAMAYDRYVAICHPLQYMLIMNWNACFQMAAASWVTSLINAVVQTTYTFKLYFCRSNVIKQFFCDLPQLMMISCSDTTVNKRLILASALCVSTVCVLFILVSYGFIFSTVFKIPSVQSRHKAFSTCTPHLTVFFLFVTTGGFSYFRPKALSSPFVDTLAAILYTVLPPLMNPIIYSLRNKEIRKALWKMSNQNFRFYLVSS